MARTRGVIDIIVFFGFTYVLGILFGLIFHLSRLFKMVKVLHWERLPKRQPGLIVVSNHPSLLEPFLLPTLFFNEYILHPFSSPWSTPDKKNFFDKWYFIYIIKYLFDNY